MFFKETFLNARRQELLAAIGKFQYRINGEEWQDGDVNDRRIEGNAAVFMVYIPSGNMADKITAVRVLDAAGQVAGEQETQIERTQVQSALLRFSFPLKEDSTDGA